MKEVVSMYVVCYQSCRDDILSSTKQSKDTTKCIWGASNQRTYTTFVLSNVYEIGPEM